MTNTILGACLHVSVYACMCVCMYVCMYTYKYRCMHMPTSIVLVFFQANSTFEYLAMIKTAAEDWLKVSPNITTYLSTNPQVEQLKVTSIKLLLCKYDSTVYTICSGIM